MTFIRACAETAFVLIASLVFALAFFVTPLKAQEVPVSGEELVCDIYAVLQATGQPIPPELESACGNGGGGGDGGEGGGGYSQGSYGDGGGGYSQASYGGGGGAAPACEDSVDNDGDNLIDMLDPGCSEAADTDETNEVISGGGGGGSGSTDTTVVATSTEEVVDEAETETEEPVPSCDMYLTAFIRPGAKNDEDQVKRLQRVLIDSEGASIDENGVYDSGTLAAVHVFQTKYASDILAPWGVKTSTGFVYLTTKKKVNEIYCKSLKAFPLSEDEEGEIARIRSSVTSSSVEEKVATPEAAIEEGEESGDVIGAAQKESQTATAKDAGEKPLNSVWERISGFFGRVLGR